MTIVSQLITDARSRFGADNVEALEVDGDLLDETMDHVLAVGGNVGIDTCTVDGVLVRERAADADVPIVYLIGSSDPHPLTPLEG